MDGFPAAWAVSVRVASHACPCGAPRAAPHHAVILACSRRRRSIPAWRGQGPSGHEDSSEEKKQKHRGAITRSTHGRAGRNFGARWVAQRAQRSSADGSVIQQVRVAKGRSQHSLIAIGRPPSSHKSCVRPYCSSATHPNREPNKRHSKRTAKARERGAQGAPRASKMHSRRAEHHARIHTPSAHHANEATQAQRASQNTPSQEGKRKRQGQVCPSLSLSSLPCSPSSTARQPRIRTTCHPLVCVRAARPPNARAHLAPRPHALAVRTKARAPIQRLCVRRVHRTNALLMKHQCLGMEATEKVLCFQKQHAGLGPARPRGAHDVVAAPWSGSPILLLD